MLVLGIESSCDETAVAIVRDDKTILSHIVLSQTEEHKCFGGVVPEIAARSHISHMDGIIKQALEQADVSFADLDGVAVTAGPGLIGGVIVGVMTAKAIASVHNKPFIAVNHLEGHALTTRLTDDVKFPFLLLLVSGGHCQILIVEGVGRYIKLGETMDDAVGEAFDKVAKMLGLEYANGAEVERIARGGNENAFEFPIPLKHRKTMDFSFSGLKTAVRLVIEKNTPPSIPQTLEGGNSKIPHILGGGNSKIPQTLGGKPSKIPHTLGGEAPQIPPPLWGGIKGGVQANICASFQKTIADILTKRMEQAIKIYLQKHDNKQLVIAGGVAANQYIKGKMQAMTEGHGFSLHCPPIKLCTDNGAMIAWAGVERLRLGMTDTLDFIPRARWEL